MGIEGGARTFARRAETRLGTCIESKRAARPFDEETPFSSSFEVEAERATLALTPEGLKLCKDGQVELIEPEGADAYDAEVAYFVECCRKNTAPERCLPQDSAKAVQLALLLKQQ
jgi:hypothetical protein